MGTGRRTCAQQKFITLAAAVLISGAIIQDIIWMKFQDFKIKTGTRPRVPGFYKKEVLYDKIN